MTVRVSLNSRQSRLMRKGIRGAGSRGHVWLLQVIRDKGALMLILLGLRLDWR